MKNKKNIIILISIILTVIAIYIIIYFSSLGYNLKDVEEVVIIADSPRPVSPCGACRQVFFEFLDVKTKVTLFNLKKERKETTVEELLPYSFVEEDMK